jgi:PAS domain S-box-containing protein
MTMQQDEHSLFKHMLEENPVGLFEADANGKLNAFNKKFINLIGIPQEQALNFNILQMVFEKDQENVTAKLKNAKNQKTEFKSEFRIVDFKGSIKWVHGIINCLFDRKGSFTGYSGGLIEINPKKETMPLSSKDNKLLEIAKDRERLLAEAESIANIGNWEWDVETNTVKWSDQLYKIFEVRPVKKITMDAYFKKIHPEDSDFVHNSILDAKVKKGEFNFQHRILLKNGVVKHLLCRGMVKVNSLNEPVLIHGTAQDITEMLRKEEDVLNNQSNIIEFQSALLKLSKTSGLSILETFQKITKLDAKLLNVGRVGIWLFNENRDAVNCSCLYKQKEKQYNFDIMVHKTDAPIYFKALEENRAIIVNDALNDETTSELSEFYLKPLGISSMLDVPIRAHGELLGILCHEHIGPKRAWTMEEQAFASSVADIVAIAIESNNRMLAENELILLNEKLALVNEHKNRFISVISHDLRNPISSIISASNLLLGQYEELKTEDRDRVIKMINSASIEALKHFDELVKIARVEDTAYLFNPQKLNLRTEVQEDIKLVSQLAAKKNISIKNEVNDKVLLMADKIMLKSILQNLLTNAIKYSYEGGEIVIFSKKHKKMEQITIIDQGIGISPEKQALLFMKNGISESKKGTKGETGSGLGLKIVKDFVEKHKGEIQVKSTIGKGTRISFTMPRA